MGHNNYFLLGSNSYSEALPKFQRAAGVYDGAIADTYSGYASALYIVFQFVQGAMTQLKTTWWAHACISMSDKAHTVAQ